MINNNNNNNYGGNCGGAHMLPLHQKIFISHRCSIVMMEAGSRL